MAFRPYASAYAGLDCLDATSEVSSRSRTPSCSSDASTACSSPGPAGTPAVFKKQTAPADAPSAKRWGLGDFSLHEQLGSGFAGCVHQVRLRGSADRSAFALKVMRKSDVVKQGQVGRVMSERRVLSSIRHPFVVEFITSFQDEARLFVLMEHVSGGDLFGVLDRAGRLPVDSARFYASEVALALDHLHSVDVLHRDLKPENVLLDCKGHVKLADFGCAKVVQGSSYTVCGTPEYTSPEMVGGGGHGKAVDWWAFGVLVFELLSGFTPFEVSDRSQAEIFRRIVAVDVEFPDHFDEESRDLVEGLLVKQPSGRLGGRGGAASVMAHPWFEAVDWSRAGQKQCAPPSVPKTSRWSPAALARGLRGLKNRNRGLGAEAVPDEQQGMFFGFSFQGPTRLDAMAATTTDGSPSCDRGAGIWWGAPSCVAAAAAALTALVLARGAGGC